MSDVARRVSRRSVLAGVAGLVVGAGGAELGSALTAAPAATDPAGNLASPGEELMTEHGVLKRVLLAYRAIDDRLAAGQQVPAGVVSDASQLISDFVESFHEGLEEAYVFPRVAPREPQLVRTLIAQHDRGRHLTADIAQLASGDLRRQSARDALRVRVAAFVRMYEPHEAWEDTVVYPTLRQTTSQHTLDQLAERFADLENKQYGGDGLATALGRVTGIEQQLGIGDLSQFTPTDVP